MGHPQIQQDTRKTRASCTCSVIDRLLEELVNEVAMGAVNLNPIKASPDGVSGRHTVQLNKPGDLRGVNRPGGWQILKGVLLLAFWAEDGDVPIITTASPRHGGCDNSADDTLGVSYCVIYTNATVQPL